jgi:catechol-2,3-dioxygenase
VSQSWAEASKTLAPKVTAAMAMVGVSEGTLHRTMIELPGGHLLELLDYSSKGNVYKPKSNDIGSSHLAFKLTRTEDLQPLLDKCKAFGFELVGDVIDVS